MTDALQKAIDAGCLKLTPENYHSDEADKGYMSVSQYKTRDDCAARWWAQCVTMEWEPEETDALASGKYFHALVLEPEKAEDALEAGRDWLLTKGSARKLSEKKAGARGLDTMAARMLATPEVNKWNQGEHEVIIVGTLGGVYWKVRVDTLDLDKGFFSDLKSTASLTKTEYVPRLGARGNFIDAYNYRLQFAVYRYILHQQFGQWLRPVLVAHQKPTPKVPDPAPLAMEFNEEALSEFDTIIQEVRYGIQEMRQQLESEDTGERCGKCEYCSQFRREWLVEIGPSPYNAYKAEG